MENDFRRRRLVRLHKFCNEHPECVNCPLVLSGVHCDFAPDLSNLTDEDITCCEEILGLPELEPAPAPQDGPVNHPSHYTSGGIECLDAIKASMTPEEYRGMLKGQVLKYIWRYRLKGQPLQDLRKAEFYLGRLIKEVETDD